jgi:hypothetical protein
LDHFGDAVLDDLDWRWVPEVFNHPIELIRLGLRVRDAVQAEPDLARAILKKDLNVRFLLSQVVERQVVVTFILFSGTDYESYTVLAFVVESDPSSHYGIKEEVELLIDPLLKLLSLQDDPV